MADWQELLTGREKILIRAKPDARKSEILSYDETTDSFAVAVHAPAQDGKANAEIERFFSKLLKKKVLVKSGLTSKKKTLRVEL